ncbi:MAG TPA: carboxypeptidase-like regulatory domain-containing protein [Bryobacteraceae bacterium]|jgi:protocatechuate 3,4-dioxygenase beta subunit|nr:carboxypeptidase-like regulatory domain-containing protein [Bryobacteraceae bacterium]
MRSIRFLAFGVIVCLLTLGTAVAQNKKQDANTRTVEGVVTDENDQPAAKAIVQLKDTKTLQVRSFITQEDGRYHFAGLSTNVDYELRAERNGMSSPTKTLSVFDDRKRPVINLKLGK